MLSSIQISLKRYFLINNFFHILLWKHFREDITTVVWTNMGSAKSNDAIKVLIILIVIFIEEKYFSRWVNKFRQSDKLSAIKNKSALLFGVIAIGGNCLSNASAQGEGDLRNRFSMDFQFALDRRSEFAIWWSAEHTFAVVIVKSPLFHYFHLMLFTLELLCKWQIKFWSERVGVVLEFRRKILETRMKVANATQISWEVSWKHRALACPTCDKNSVLSLPLSTLKS